MKVSPPLPAPGELMGGANLVAGLTFSCVAESEGPAATSTIMLSPLCGRQTALMLARDARQASANTYVRLLRRE